MTATAPKKDPLVPSTRQLAAVGAAAGGQLPTLFWGTPDRGKRFWEFFTVNIRNRNTRRAYFVAISQFSVWCEGRGLEDLSLVEPMHVAAYIEQLGTVASKPTVSSISPRFVCSLTGWSRARSFQQTQHMRSAGLSTV